MKRFLITGIGRSGTKYMSELLSSVGINCTWERVFKPNRHDVNWNYIEGGESSWLAAPYIAKLPADTVIVHVTRNPIKWINSWLKVTPKWGPQFTNFVDDHCGFFVWKDGYHPTVDMKVYVNWNNMIEEAAQDPKFTYLRYKVEDIDSATIFQFSQLVRSPTTQVNIFKSINDLGTNVNASKPDPSYKPVTWDSLPAGPELDAFKAMAIKYGYSVG